MNEHENIRAKLAELVAGALPASEEAAARTHLAQCPECARELDVWQRLATTMKRIPETPPTPARLARIAALAQARRAEVLEQRRNRLVLTGLALYGWALFLTAWPALESLTGWLGVSGSAVAPVAVLGWIAFTWMISFALLPLLRSLKATGKEKTA